MRRWRVVAVATGVALGLVPLAGCLGDETTDDASDGVRIAAFDFAESELLAEIYAQAMESHGVPVDRLGAVGPREIVAPALRIGEIDVVPDYVGTAAAYFGAENGARTMYMVFDLREPSQLPTIAEPLFQTLQAQITLAPIMTFEDVKTGLAQAHPQG